MESEDVGEEAVFGAERGGKEGGGVQAYQQDVGRGCPHMDEEKAEQTNPGGGGEVETDSWIAKSCLCRPGQAGGENEGGGGKEEGEKSGARLEEINKAGGKTRPERGHLFHQK